MQCRRKLQIIAQRLHAPALRTQSGHKVRNIRLGGNARQVGGQQRIRTQGTPQKRFPLRRRLRQRCLKLRTVRGQEYGSARFVALFSAQDKPMTELPGWPASFATREINIPCPDNAKFAVVEKVKAHFRALYDTIELDGARVNFPHGWGLVRASNTQPVLVTRFEADSAEALAAIREEMETPLKKWIEEAE